MQSDARDMFHDNILNVDMIWIVVVSIKDFKHEKRNIRPYWL